MRFLALGMLVLLSGCGPAGGWQDSGICRVIGDEKWLSVAGMHHGISDIKGGSEDYFFSSAGECDSAYGFQFRIDEGTLKEFLADYQKTLIQEIESLGAEGSGDGHDRTKARDWEMNSFSYRYRLNGNLGFINVTAFSVSDSEVILKSFCYEHRW